ncbi:LOW QUALITY PROTEIN: meprin A subunit beta-like [Dendronephthya gigantea]|uniref:LOW QUALITY PROTEIN: meprin A subunit beta-like n=1 Tax=Dendronephthya gigantea TaxID=151771 RepID=UPI001069511F|nr:LOW QUALITY PROTEIN: meprin A subunit beta-like [Dendronephthya gigantea]
MFELNWIAFGLVLLIPALKTTSFIWEENNDPSLFEADIRLLSQQRFALETTGDIDAPIGVKRGITNEEERLWPGGIVPYNITEDLLDNTEAMIGIHNAFKEWESQSCLTFIPRTTEPDYIEFFGAGGGCWSYVGRVGGMQQISLGEGCYGVGTIAHEIGHAVGFWHEQSRPDRDEHVEILWHNIPDNRKHNFNKYNRSQIDSLGSEYDYMSVMHYSSTAFGGGNITIVPKDPSVIQLGQRKGLSPLDVQQADLLYKCNGQTTIVTPPPPSRPPPPSGPYDCTFENGTCGYRNEKKCEELDTFDWTLRIAGTPSGKTGPEADHTTGHFGHFFYIEASSPRQPDDNALLESPEYPATDNNQCFAFYYHMLGKHIGELNVYTKQGFTNNLVWSKNETQGDIWHQGKIQLPVMPKAFKVVFEGVRGDGYQGDIAIDDVHFLPGNCPETI